MASMMIIVRTSTDLPASFAAMAGPATFSTVYTANDKAGTTMSCDAAWGYIADRLADNMIFDAYSDQICARTGFDVTQATQRDRCRQQIDGLGT
jgi:conjugal transfer mating pair stabilization protein TraG